MVNESPISYNEALDKAAELREKRDKLKASYTNGEIQESVYKRRLNDIKDKIRYYSDIAKKYQRGEL